MMSTGYMFAYAIGQFICGRFADTVRPKRALVWGMLCCALLPILEGFLGIAGCGGEGFCYILWVLARVTEGLVQATGWTSTVAIMGNWFPQEGRGFIMGIWATNSNVGDIFGLEISSALVDVTEWYVILWVLAGWGSQLTRGSAVEAWRLQVLPSFSLMILWAVVNMIFLRGAPPPFSLTWQYEEAAQTKAISIVDQELAGTSASFCQILMVPGLLQYAFSYMFIKLVNYALFLWLPFYLSKGIGVDKSLANQMATRFDLGFIVGAIVAGLLSDITTHWAGMPMRPPAVIRWAIFCCGILQGGPADALTSAVSVDLGKHPSLKGQRAISTVTGIIDGTGAVGAAVGQYMVGMLSEGGGLSSSAC
eukprot:Skav202903  [mRNA]  locus=scaffold3908:82544:85047:- [translate_table: standard]